MILTEHARRRVKERFLGWEGERLLREFEQARRPTRKEADLILRFRREKHIEGRSEERRLVSPAGIVFVVTEDVVVVTLFPFPKHARRCAHSVTSGHRRLKEKRWLREVTEGEDG